MANKKQNEAAPLDPGMCGSCSACARKIARTTARTSPRRAVRAATNADVRLWSTYIAWGTAYPMADAVARAVGR